MEIPQGTTDYYYHLHAIVCRMYGFLTNEKGEIMHAQGRY